MGDASEAVRLAAYRHLLLTTYRADGRPVHTVVWAIRRADLLAVITGARTGKVARIRLTPEVLLAPSDADGNRLPGTGAVAATATVIGDRRTVREVRRLIRSEYGWRYLRATVWLRLAGGRDAEVAILIRPGATGR